MSRIDVYKLRSVIRKDGIIKSAFVGDEAIKIGEYEYKERSPISFYNNGIVKCGILDKISEIGEMNFSNEVPILFHKNGSIKSGLLVGGYRYDGKIYIKGYCKFSMGGILLYASEQYIERILE